MERRAAQPRARGASLYSTEGPRFQLWVELVKALAWPITALIILICFWGPLQEIAGKLPTILGQSESITIAGLSIKVGARLKAQASPAIEAALSAMSPEDIKRLLSHSGSAYWNKGDETFGRNENASLVRLGLLEEVPASKLDPRYGYGISLTEKGKNVQNFLYQLIAEFADELHVQKGRVANKPDAGEGNPR